MSTQALVIEGNVLKKVNSKLIDDDGHVTIPNGVTSIDAYAFAHCINLTSVAIPNSVTSIGSWAFSYCKNLSSITIPNGVVVLRTMLASGCRSLTSITLHLNIKGCAINSMADNANLSTIKIPTDNLKEFNRVKSLLPEELQDKAVIVPPLERVKKIKESALNNLLFNNHTNILKACGSANSLNNAIAQGLNTPNTSALGDALKIINTYDTSKIYKQVKRQLDALIYPADENDLILFGEDCMAIINEAINNSSLFNKYPDVHPEVSNSFNNDYGFFQRVRNETIDASPSEQTQSTPN